MEVTYGCNGAWNFAAQDGDNKEKLCELFTEFVGKLVGEEYAKNHVYKVTDGVTTTTRFIFE